MINFYKVSVQNFKIFPNFMLKYLTQSANDSLNKYYLPTRICNQSILHLNNFYKHVIKYNFDITTAEDMLSKTRCLSMSQEVLKKQIELKIS
ncbi:hypothetical protein BpHYR1_028763 [Brachionus plicatilis]|uniref:Uncharacterized protein n=1 Tax=Brachionus plicatilis TaxID=10195 RepID=A0A3M7RSW8_BRAPC|nr:hypothetical protein BpHYR1_028763 [Brachionus plicatilis]